MTEDVDRTQHSYFAKYDEYNEALQQLLAFSDSDGIAPLSDEESPIYLKITQILDQYQEQAYLLDPYLERMVLPLLERFKQRAIQVVDEGVKTERRWWMPMLTYHVIKTRGSKTVARMFPHGTSDLRIALSYLDSVDTTRVGAWETSYVTLLWLSLVVKLPFDLAQFDKGVSGATFAALEAAGKNNLAKAGLEREAAAVLLSRLYARKDCAGQFRPFVHWAIERLDATSDSFFAIGALHMLCEWAKSENDVDKVDLGPMRDLLQCFEGNTTLMSNTLVRKWKIKLTARMALCELPSRAVVALTRKKRLMEGTPISLSSHQPEIEVDVPPTVELIIEELLTAVQDRDTVVRWCAAKGLARVAERLPSEYSTQVLESILGLFAIHEIEGEGGIQDLPAAAEATWHGATLACAELARRGLVGKEQLAELLDWMKKGLYFDIRKGAHSIGSNVRDAVAYVLWALARAQDAESFKPYALEVAQRLVVASLFDREVHVRRAASAAYQENVGRMSLFPHGIDIIRCADYFSVSVKRLAFTVAAPQVAEYDEYRGVLIEHLLRVSLKHWDPSIRRSAAISLRRICELDLSNLGPSCTERAVRLAQSFDSNDIHGGLLVLAELAGAYKESKIEIAEALRLQVFKNLVELPPSTFSHYRNDLIIEASCTIIANGLSTEALKLAGAPTAWRDLVTAGMKSRDVTVQDAASAAMLADFLKSPLPVQQCTTRTLGVLAFSHDPEPAKPAINCLLQIIDEKSPIYCKAIEPRQNAYDSLPNILKELRPVLFKAIEPSLSRQVYQALMAGVLDYSTDQRGDVGSWVRMSCIRGLVDVAVLYFESAKGLVPFDEWLPPDMYALAVAGILRQAAERLDNVRQVAADQLVRLINCALPSASDADRWRLGGEEVLRRELIETADEFKNWSDGGWLYPKLVHLLTVPQYRSELLMGFILSIGSRSERTTHPASTSLVNYAMALSTADLRILVDSILKVAQTNGSSNSIFVPVVHTLDVLLDGGVLSKLASTDDGPETLRAILACVTRGIDKIKSVDRILAATKLVTGLIGLPPVAVETTRKLPSFLGHRLPKVRTTAAEALYLSLQGVDVEVDDEVEDLLLQTTWSGDLAELEEPMQEIVTKLKESLEASGGT